MDGAESSYGVMLSDNMELTHEGYLKCYGAIIARTGIQTYRFSQLPQDEAAELGIVGNPDDLIDLYRDEEDVFDPVFMESLEGKDITDRHPDKLLTIDTVLDHSVGHMSNVRRGEEALDSGDWPLLADLVIKSKSLIARIRGGLRQLSCGYTYHIAKDGNRILQVEMLGNHCAVLPSGRAGNAEILDANDLPKKEFPVPDFSKMTAKQRFSYVWGLGMKALAGTENIDPSDLSTAAEAMDGGEKPAVPAAGKGKHADKGKRERAGKGSKGAEGMDAEREAAHALVDKMYDAHESASDAEQTKLAEAREELMDMMTSTAALDSDDDEDEDEDDDEGEAEDGEDDGEEAADEDAYEDVIPVEDRNKPAIPAFDAKGKAGKDGKGKGAKDAMDSADALIKRMKPFIAKSKDKKLQAAFDEAVKTSKRGSRTRREGAGYAGFARAGQAALDAAPNSNANIEARNKAAAEAKVAKRAAYK